MTDLDVLVRRAVERARREAASVAVPAPDDVTARRATTHRRRRIVTATLATVVVAGGVFAIAATRSDDTGRPRITVPPATVSAVRPARASLEFREMFSVKDFKGCRPTPDHPRGQAVLPDRPRTYCYTVGPVIIDGSGVAAAAAVFSQQTQLWDIHLHFDNEDFVAKVTTPHVNQQIAIVVDGVVQAAPTINPGITGEDVTISGTFTRAEAEDLARSLSP